MAMNTPIGNITQITPISSFVTLGNVALDQYMLGINNFVQGDGSKVTLKNLIASMVNTTEEKNILTLDEDGRLQAIEATSPFGQDNGWAVVPELSINWNNRTVSGFGGHAYKDGFEIEALRSFVSPAFTNEAGKYYLYYDGNDVTWSRNTKPDSDYLIAEVDIDANSRKMAVIAYSIGGINKTVRDYLNAALGTIIIDGGDITNINEGEVVATNAKPHISAVKIGGADYNYQIPALTDELYTRVQVTNQQLIYRVEQSGIVPLSANNLPVIVDSSGVETEILNNCALNIWLVGVPLFGSNPENMEYQFVVGSNQYDSVDIAKATSPTAEITMQYIIEQYNRCAIIARFTIERVNDTWNVADFEKYNPLTGGSGSAGGVGLTEVTANEDYFDGKGTPVEPLTISDEVKFKLDEVKKDVNNVYKILNGHKSHDGRLWDLIEYHDALDKDQLLLGGTEETYTSNTSSANYHFILLDSVAGTNQPAAAARTAVYNLFNNQWANNATANVCAVADGTIGISCAKKIRISRIEIRSGYNVYSMPQLHVTALNRDNPLTSEVSLADFANSKYIGGLSSVMGAKQYDPQGSGKEGLRRPLMFNLNEKDYYNTFFICFDNYSSASNYGRYVKGIRIFGSIEETQDSDFEPKSEKLLKVLGDYDVKMNGKGYNKNAFTVVGSPTITRNGIASGFSGSDYITHSALTFSNNFSIEFGINGQTATAQQTFLSFGNNANGFIVRTDLTNTRYYVDYWTSNAQTVVSSTVPFSEGLHKIKLTYNGETFNFYLDGILVDTKTIALDLTKLEQLITLGFTPNTSWYCNSSIDLKQFSITVDGETVLNGGIEYENCKWVSSNGTVYNVADLVEQYGEIPQERVTLDRWVSCLGHRFGGTKQQNQYYPCLVDGDISVVGTVYSGTPAGVCRQTDYMPATRITVGYGTTGGFARMTNSLGGTHVWDYVATDTFPAGEYFAELLSGCNTAAEESDLYDPAQYNINQFKIQCLDADDNVLYQQAFACEGSMYDETPLYRTPRFYMPTAFKKMRVVTLDATFPQAYHQISQIQLYLKDNEDTTGMSFIPSPTEFDLSCNMVRHITNKHFFITPTGIRVGSNCFVDQVDPTIEQACVGNRWINEDTRKSYVCNESGVWEEEDFCEIACMMLWGSEHKGMLKRTVFNEENPLERYVQDYGNLGGQLAFDDNVVPNAFVTVATDPDAQDFYFVAESDGTTTGQKVFYPSKHLAIQAFYRQHVRSKIYESGEQYAVWSNGGSVPSRMIAYKTWETEAAGEYIESEDIE